MTKLKDEIIQLTDNKLRIPTERISRVIQLMDRGWSNTRIKSEQGKFLLGVYMRSDTIKTIRYHMVELKALLSKYDGVVRLDLSRVEATDLIVDSDSAFDYFDDRKKQYGIPDSADPFAEQRLLSVQQLEASIPELNLSVKHLEDIGFDTEEALIFLHDLYALYVPRYNAEVVKNGVSMLKPFTGLEQYISMLREVISRQMYPTFKVAKTAVIEMPRYYMLAANKLYAEGLLNNDIALMIASKGILAFAIWRGGINPLEFDRTAVINLENLDDVNWLAAEPTDNIYTRYFYDSLAGLSVSQTEHSTMVQRIKDTLAQQHNSITKKGW